MPIMSNKALAAQAREIWRRYRSGGDRPNEDEANVMRNAYWAGVLPVDHEYSVGEWVETGMPALP